MQGNTEITTTNALRNASSRREASTCIPDAMKNSKVEIPEDNCENIVQPRIKCNSQWKLRNCLICFLVFVFGSYKITLVHPTHKGMVSLIEAEGGAKKCLLGKGQSALKLLSINKVSSIAMTHIWTYMKGSKNDLLKKKERKYRGRHIWEIKWQRHLSRFQTTQMVSF